MEKPTIQTSSYALNFGTMLGIASVFFSLMLFFLDAHYQGDTLSSTVPLILSVGFINFGIYQFKKDNTGFISLSQGLKVGVGIALISGIIGTIYGIILTEFLDPQFMDKTFEIAKQKMLDGNQELSVEDANQAIEMSKKFTTLPIRIAGGLLGSIFIGFLISLIGGLILKKSKPE
ncbi:MAG: DUF4199 domain-containing protein [Flavobacteriaceae bacterium]|nr:DUF4199 domain-containing protein [Flavobacteriaceae bacterium]